MLLGIITTILNLIGIYGYFSGHYTLLVIGAIATIVESLIGFFSGAQKGFGLATMIFFSFLCFIFERTPFKAITLGLCFDGAIMFFGGLIIILIYSRKTLTK